MEISETSEKSKTSKKSNNLLPLAFVGVMLWFLFRKPVIKPYLKPRKLTTAQVIEGYKQKLMATKDEKY